jgi:predicted CoA-binding protein
MTDHDSYSEATLRAILTRTRTIAMVGASTNWNRPSYFVQKYLIGKGFRVIPINPTAAGQELLGETVVASLQDVPVPVDMIDIFRNAEAASGIVDEAIALRDTLGAQTIWMQLGVRNDAAAARAEAAGFDVVMNRCPKIEFARLSGELGWSGLDTGLVSARRPALPKRSWS